MLRKRLLILNRDQESELRKRQRLIQWENLNDKKRYKDITMFNYKYILTDDVQVGILSLRLLMITASFFAGKLLTHAPLPKNVGVPARSILSFIATVNWLVFDNGNFTVKLSMFNFLLKSFLDLKYPKI